MNKKTSLLLAATIILSSMFDVSMVLADSIGINHSSIVIQGQDLETEEDLDDNENIDGEDKDNTEDEEESKTKFYDKILEKTPQTLDDGNKVLLEVNQALERVKTDKGFTDSEGQRIEYQAKLFNKKFEILKFIYEIKKEEEVIDQEKVDKEYEDLVSKIISAINQREASQLNIEELNNLFPIIKDNGDISDFAKLKMIEMINSAIKIEQDRLEKKEDISLSELELKKFKDDIEIYIDRNEAYLYIPSLEIFDIKYSIEADYNRNNFSEKGENKKEIRLPKMDERTYFTVDIEIYNSGKMVNEVSKRLVFDDTERPTIEYIEMKRDKLIIDYEDNYLLDRNPVGISIDGEREELENGNEFVVPIPSDIEITIYDLFGNTTSERIGITEDSKIVRGRKLDGSIVSSKVKEVNKNFRNLGSIAIPGNASGVSFDILKDFNSFIKDIIGSYQKDDLFIESSDKNLEIKSGKDKGIIIIKEAGVYEVSIAKGNSDEKLTIKIFVSDPNNFKKSYIKEIESKELSKNITNSPIKPSDIMNITWLKNTKNKDMNTDNLFIRNKYGKNEYIAISFRDSLLLKEGVNDIEILDAIAGKIYNFNLKYSQAFEYDNLKTTSFVKYFTDVNKSDWYSSSVTIATQDGVILGYPDRTFRPNNNITVREFLSSYGRSLSLISGKNDLNKNNISTIVSPSNWSYKAANNVLKRINQDKLDKFDFTNLDRPILREEVAYIIANSLGIESNSSIDNFKDAGSSAYKNEINALKAKQISLGFPDGEFKPKNNITRAELVELIVKLY